MFEVAGVRFRGSKPGKANPANIPEDDFADNYLIDAGSKRKSSLLVVDADGYLRRGSVKRAWRYRNNTNRDVEDDIRKLATYFDENPLPAPDSDRYTPDMTLDIEETLAFAAQTPGDDIDFSHTEFEERVGTGFNEHGIRKNYADDGDTIQSVDVLFEAMEPGPPERRNGIRITEDFLRKVGEKDYSDEPPHLVDHARGETFSKIGNVKDVWFSDRLGKLMVMTQVPNIDSPTYQEAIARYTHSPPEIQDGSAGFGQQYEAVRNDDGEPELRDGRLKEFSAVNFPGGYDDGGVKAAFAEAAVEEANAIEFDDPTGESNGENSAADDDVDSEFTVNTETLNF